MYRFQLWRKKNEAFKRFARRMFERLTVLFLIKKRSKYQRRSEMKGNFRNSDVFAIQNQ